MSNQYKGHIDRVAEEAEDYLPERKTGVECEYLNHRGEFEAVLIVKVNNVCCGKEENSEVRLCWVCATRYAARDQFYCRCGEEDSMLTSDQLTFTGEIQPKEQEAQPAQ